MRTGKVVDVGGSMVIHLFGAYFGVAAALAMARVQKHKVNTCRNDYPAYDS